MNKSILVLVLGMFVFGESLMAKSELPLPAVRNYKGVAINDLATASQFTAKIGEPSECEGTYASSMGKVECKLTDGEIVVSQNGEEIIRAKFDTLSYLLFDKSDRPYEMISLFGQWTGVREGIEVESRIVLGLERSLKKPNAPFSGSILLNHFDVQTGVRAIEDK